MQQRISDLGPEGPAEAALHPRLEELREKYGDMAIRPSRSRTSENATLGEQLLDLGIVHTGMPSQNLYPITAGLLSTISVPTTSTSIEGVIVLDHNSSW